MYTSTNDLYLGRDHSGSSFFKGSMDEMKLFNILLGAGEVKDLYVDTGRDLGGYYPLGSRGNEDFSGNGNDGTIKGSPTSVQNFSKINNRAYEFDGIDDFIEVPHSNSLNGKKFTVTAWIKPSNSNRTWRA